MPDGRSSQTGLWFDRFGAGEPLLLIHGTGSSRLVWKPVLDPLAAERDVIAIDLPGHGESPLGPEGFPPTPAGYARVVADLLEELGLRTIDIAGNSVGAWTALELAKAERARSVVALAPPGLWRNRNPRSAYAALWMMHYLPPPPASALKTKAGRTLLMRKVCGRPSRVPHRDAIQAMRDMASVRGFNEHLKATSRTRFVGGQEIAVPVTVAFGERERLIPRRARRRDELPEHAELVSLPGCGHVPMWDDPPLIARTILDGVSRRATAG